MLVAAMVNTVLGFIFGCLLLFLFCGYAWLAIRKALSVVQKADRVLTKMDEEGANYRKAGHARKESE